LANLEPDERLHAHFSEISLYFINTFYAGAAILDSEVRAGEVTPTFQLRNPTSRGAAVDSSPLGTWKLKLTSSNGKQS